VLLIALGAGRSPALSDTTSVPGFWWSCSGKSPPTASSNTTPRRNSTASASALLVHDERTLDATLRQLNQFGYDLDRLQFVAKDEVELLGQVR